MNNIETLKTIELIYGKIFTGNKLDVYFEIDKDELQEWWLNSSIYDLKSEFKYLKEVLKTMNIKVSTYSINMLLITNMYRNNPIGLKTLYKMITVPMDIMLGKLKITNNTYIGVSRHLKTQFLELKKEKESEICMFPSINYMNIILNEIKEYYKESMHDYESIVSVCIGKDKEWIITKFKSYFTDEIVYRIYENKDITKKELTFIKEVLDYDCFEECYKIDFTLLEDIFDIKELEICLI